jgi:16S rRNA (adenine(1408)-N(1))-methyltransferase
VDLGTGDGRFVLAHAAAHRERFVLGVDPSHAGMTEASRRAARSEARGGLPNAAFVVSSLDALPVELDGLADLVTVHFPWGTLRSAVAGQDPEAMARLVRLLAPAGRLELLIADGERDGTAPNDPETILAAYAALGLEARESRPATLTDAVAAHSSWGKRLLRNPTAGRSAWRFGLSRPSADSDGRG